MKVLTCFTLFGLCGSLFADGIDRQEGNKIIAPQSGIYAGLGLVMSNDRYDFSLNSFGIGETEYKTTNYQKTQRNYNGQLFIGYQIVSPIFAALELSYTLNKASIENNYNSDELPGGEVLGHNARLSMKYGNDLALKLKIGKSCPIGVGNSCHHITPYIVVGIHERSIEANFDYPSPAVNLNDLVQGVLGDFSYANHKMKSRKLGFVWGLGTSIALEKELTIGVEYNCRKMRNSYQQKTLPRLQDRLDIEGHARHYSIKGRNGHSFTIWMSKNISFD